MIKTAGWLYMAGASTLVEQYGADGQKSVREWLRNWGDWRGKELRKAHMALGLPINMESLCKYWDSAAATGHLMEEWLNEGSWEPYNVRVPVKDRKGACPISEPWRENNFWELGHVLCDEFHIHFVRGYHPDAVVVIPKCIMKRDALCDFNFVMPPNSREPEAVAPYPGQNVLQDWKTESDEEGVLSGLKRKTRITAGRIFFLWEAIIKRFPESAGSIFKTIMEKWADSRSWALRQEQEMEIGPESLKDFFYHLDHPYSIVWETSIKASENCLEIEVSYCPFAETWQWLGELKAMRMFCESCYSRIGKHCQPPLEGDLGKCMCKGDDICEIRISRL
jgi:hypothetical protein